MAKKSKRVRLSIIIDRDLHEKLHQIGTVYGSMANCINAGIRHFVSAVNTEQVRMLRKNAEAPVEEGVSEQSQGDGLVTVEQSSDTGV